ncbi:phage integrase SAM-like domain-containing protein [Winogradskyella sp. F6397]|uniref:Phage integrase SAM-like domain-containing protein n=1 Tax=Winogradskyella marina TaxID=2785530 RepID=A0ABS0ELH5_9FLAO|nr:phage integrase SAM-like domain-containing protein [Winogradskyella marina]MBF8151319.1 phage integrase SAM-like domain-containing protein [Winogradskyella marina]
MASIKYRVRQNKSGESIYLRFKPGLGADYEVSTGIKIPKGKWSVAKEQINQTDKLDYGNLNKKLRDLKVHINKEFENDNLEGTVINTKWLRSAIKNFFNQNFDDDKINSEIYLLPFLDQYINGIQKRVDNGDLDVRTVKYFESLKVKLIGLQDELSKKIKLKDINVAFNQRFISYLTNKHHLSPNTIGRYVKYVAQLCREAEMKGYEVSKDYKSKLFKAPSNRTQDVYLTEDEIYSIFSHEFKDQKLDNARDWLIIAVWTGLRVSDLLKLDSTYIKDDEFIELSTKKTETPVLIHVNPYIRSILNKRDGQFPLRIFPQKFNNYIKTVCREVGITKLVSGAKVMPREILENGKKVVVHRKTKGKYPKCDLISSHVGRRSFATNMYGKLPTLTIMKITGHATEKEFLGYIKRTQVEYAKQQKDYWDKRSSNK